MEKKFNWATGRRKTSVARVRVRLGSGTILVNGRDMEEYFPREDHRVAVKSPLKVSGNLGQYDVVASVGGGGPTGQADAMSLGIARALVKCDSSFYEIFREAGLLTRDSRRKERKKYGLRGARRAPQFSKR